MSDNNSINVETYSFGIGDHPTDRGVMISADRPGPVGKFTEAFADVFVSEAGVVELDEYRWPIADFAAWLDAVQAEVREQIGGRR